MCMCMCMCITCTCVFEFVMIKSICSLCVCRCVWIRGSGEPNHGPRGRPCDPRASPERPPIEHEPRCHSKRHNTPELDRSTASNSGQRLPLDLELHYPLLEAVDRPPNLDVLREFTFFSDRACDDTPEKAILATIRRGRKPAIPSRWRAGGHRDSSPSLPRNRK